MSKLPPWLKPPPWLEDMRAALGPGGSPEAVDAALRIAGNKPSPSRRAYVRRLENAWRKPYRQRPSSFIAWPNRQTPKTDIAIDPKGWGPIETAPEDQIVVLCVPRGGEQPPTIFEGGWDPRNREWRSADDEWSFFGSPTQWQPCYEFRAGFVVVEVAQSKNAPNPVLKRPQRAPRRPVGRPKRVQGVGSPIERTKRNLAIATALWVGGYLKRAGKQRAPKLEVLKAIREAIPYFAKACGARLPETDYHVFAQDIYSAALKTERYKLLIRDNKWL